MKHYLTHLINNLLPKGVYFFKRNIITISTFLAAYAVFFCVQPVWHEETELPDDLKEKLNSVTSPCLSSFVKEKYKSFRK